MRQPGMPSTPRSMNQSLAAVGIFLCLLGGTVQAGTNSSPTGSGTSPEPLCFQDSQGLGYVCPPTSSTKTTTGGTLVSEPITTSSAAPVQPASAVELWINDLLNALK